MPTCLSIFANCRDIFWKKSLISQCFLITAILVAAPVFAETVTLAQALQGPDHVLLMRHADAPGIGDPAGYVLGNCKTQRNLGERGKQQAQLLGEWLRAHGVTSAKVVSSPWCRCIDTATGLNFGAINVEPSLGSFFSDVGSSAAQTRELEKFIANTLPHKQGKALILVTHQVNILEYSGENVGSGDMILVKVDRQGKVISANRYSGSLSNSLNKRP
ncbi:histidine phosphatase family protein [Herminiimonas aquatilis]|uniref:Histidine phosphatase family protein n=1 Tax=Herminiimonas aquatilis TaxID=345342 RepID=A0ABW2J2F1_9BURK